GGGYMPIISDKVYMTEQAYMVIAGAALLKGAKSQQVTSHSMGGAEVHVHSSGCADMRVPDDATLLRALRREVGLLPSSAADYFRQGSLGHAPAGELAPRFAPGELPALLPIDHREGYDAREVLARLCDQSLFWELMPGCGTEVICGVARFGGLLAGVVTNQQGLVQNPDAPGQKRPGGILYREGIAKLSAFRRACSSDGLPMIWLQDVAGFDIGPAAEQAGLLGLGSNLIYSHSSDADTPVFTVLLRKAAGAGYYAMQGLPYDPVLQLSTCLSRQAVMEGRTLAIATYRTRLDDDFRITTSDEAERAALQAKMQAVEARIEADMNPLRAAARMDTDEVVELIALRPWLCTLVEAAYQSTGYRRRKNPRIWSLH
ncbi:MAG: carboxyl transferase domain-containing protein, partial [Polyangiales bacterium]